MGLFTQKSRYWQQKLGGLTPKAPPSLAEAFQLFDHLAILPHLALHTAAQGTAARTHLMCVELLRRGYLPRKAWILRDDHTGAVHSHAAPVLMVNAGPAQGGVIAMVFDPALLDGPATGAVWAAALGVPTKDVQIVALGHAPPGYRGDYLPHLDKTAPDSLIFTNALTDDHARRHMAGLAAPSGQALQRRVQPCGLREPQYKPLWRTEGAVAPFIGTDHPALTSSPRL